MKKQTKTLTVLLLATLMLLLLSSSDGFVVVVRPPHHHHHHHHYLEHAHEVATKPKPSSTTELELSSRSFDDSNEPKKTAKSLLGRVANFFTPWWLKHKQEEVDTGEDGGSDVMLSPRQLSKTELAKRRQMHDALQPFPWPFRATGEAITRSINRQLSQEQEKAKPLLKDAQRLIQKDKELLALLGTPVQIQPIFSGSSSTSTINWKKTKRIVDKFVVEGSKKKGVATLTADKYARGHILALRVDVSGVHYDIDT